VVVIALVNPATETEVLTVTFVVTFVGCAFTSAMRSPILRWA